jgi:hypothetical protein
MRHLQIHLYIHNAWSSFAISMEGQELRRLAFPCCYRLSNQGQLHCFAVEELMTFLTRFSIDIPVRGDHLLHLGVSQSWIAA